MSEAKLTSNYSTYGVLYNWTAMMTEGICPSGWHISSDVEWQTMEMSIGMSESEANDTAWRGTDEGYQMKSTSGWNSITVLIQVASMACQAATATPVVSTTMGSTETGGLLQGPVPTLGDGN